MTPDVPVRALAIERIAIRQFRNLECVDLEFSPGFNVVSGDNGQGKTNLLEAIYAVATSKSFRSPRLGELISLGRDVASVRATIVASGLRREQSLGLQSGVRKVTLDGKRPQTLADYAVRTPAVVFHPGEMALSMGGGTERRRLLDRISLYVTPGSASSLDSYVRALRERQRALAVRGPSASDLPDWEDLMVLHGSAVARARADAALRIAGAAVASFARTAAPLGVLEVRYAPGAPPEASEFRLALASARAKDAFRKTASVGPHRDDLALSLDSLPVRGRASQGQHRAVVLSLKSAELDVLSLVCGVRPVLLLDDVSSELDRSRTKALFSELQKQEGQVFLSTTRPELIELEGSASAPRLDFTVRAGVVSPGSSRPNVS